MVRHRLDNRRRGGCDVGTDLGAFGHMVGRPDRGCKDLGFEPVVVIDGADIFDQFQPVEVDIIKATDKGRDKGRAGLGGQKCLIGRETQGDIDHRAFVGQRLTGLETVPCQRNLDRDVFGDLGQFAAFGDHVVGFQRDNFGRNGARNDVTDFLGHFEDVTTGFRDDRWVGGDTIHHPQVIEFPDGINIGGVYEEFHGSGSFGRVGTWMASVYLMGIKGGTQKASPMSQDFFQEGELVGVLTTQPLDRLLDYKAPEGGCWLGAFVEVPLGPRRVLGVVWGAGRGDFDLAKVRSVSRVLDVAPMREEMRQFLGRVADYTLTPMPAMLRLATRAPGLGDAPSMRKVYRLGSARPNKLTDARAKVLDTLRDYGGLSFTLGELAEMAGVGTSVVKGLVKLAAISEEDAPRDLPYPALDPDYGGKTLTEDQTLGANALCAAVRSGAYGTTLLRGVTGSGKTEVYLEAVAECLRQGRQALVLLPEIALTSEFIHRVEARFGMPPAE